MVTFLGRFIGGIEAIGIFHDKFLGPHEAKARPNFIPKLGLNLVEVFWHLPIRIDLARDQSGDYFLVRGTKNPFLFRPVSDLEQHIFHRLISAALLPDIRRLQHGHQKLKRPCAVHFLADDVLDFAQGPQSEWQKSVKPAREFADESRAQQQLMRSDLRFGRRLFQSRNEGL